MENQKKKCSLKKHLDIDAVNYCYDCKIYVCNKCLNHHSELFENKHHLINLEKDSINVFIDVCRLNNHNNKYDYFCKTHNELCCSSCIAKIKNETYGQHTDCEVCLLKDIKNEKINKLKDNVKFLEELSMNLEKSIKELKDIYEKINENKEEIKLKIQKVFTKIRNTINDREDQLLLDIDKKFNKEFFDEDIIKQSEKLPSKVKISLEKGKLIDKELENNETISLINNCINIENNIKDINILNENIKTCNTKKDIKFKFFPQEEELEDFLEKIKLFGEIVSNNYTYKFKKCPINIKEERKYKISGEKENIITKTGTNGYWMGTICEKELEKGKVHKWKIKILKTTSNKRIMVGVAPNDFDINSSSYNTCGWYLYCHTYYSNPVLYSGPPYNYNCKNTNLNKIKDEIIVLMDMSKRALKFIIDNEDKGDSYINIPIDKPIFPAIILYDKDDSVQIISN